MIEENKQENKGSLLLAKLGSLDDFEKWMVFNMAIHHIEEKYNIIKEQVENGNNQTN